MSNEKPKKNVKSEEEKPFYGSQEMPRITNIHIKTGKPRPPSDD